MLPRRILLVSLLVPILTVSLVSLVLISYPTLLWPLRRDPVPEGAYLVPWTRPNPSIDVLDRTRPYEAGSQLVWDLHTVMKGALRLDITYKIDVPDGTREIPSTVYLAHDRDYLYVGGIFHGMYENPTSEPVEVTYSNYLAIYFDVENDGGLSSPESGSRFPSYICPSFADCNGRPNSLMGSTYHDMAWVDYSSQVRRGAWDLAQNVCRQPFADENFVAEYGSDTGTLSVLYARRLRLPGSCANALQMRPGERWTMGFLLELGYSNKYTVYQDFVDGWPKRAYPYLTNDASWWPKLVIDLANPPASFTI